MFQSSGPHRKRSESHYAALDRLAQVLLRPDDLPLLIDRTLSLLTRILGADGGWLLRGVDPEAKQVRRVVFARGAEDCSCLSYAEVPLDGPARAFLRELLSSEACVLRTDEAAQSWPVRNNFKTAAQLAVPLWLNMGGPWVLGLDRSPQAPEFSEAEQALITAAADRVASALELRIQQDSARQLRPSSCPPAMVEFQLQHLLDATPDLVCFKDAAGLWLQTNRANLQLFQLEGVEYRGRHDMELAELTDPRLRPAFEHCCRTDDEAWAQRGVWRGEERVEAPDGSDRHFEIIKVPCFHDDGERRGLVVIGRDVTTQRSLLAEQRLAAAAVESSAEAMLILDAEGHILQANSAYEQLCGRDQEQVRGCFIGDAQLVGLPAEVGRAIELARSKSSWAGELRVDRVDEPVPVWISVNLVEVTGATYFIVNAADISQLRDSEAAIAHMASHDPLTGLLNRPGFEAVLNQMLKRGAAVELHAVDITDFKAINDSLGNAAGDTVLVEVAHRLRRIVGPSTPLARTGGDEFALAVNVQTQNEGDPLFKRLQSIRSEPIKVGKLSLALSWCAGVVRSPDGGASAGALLRNAGAALNRAKAAGPGSLRRYSTAMTANASERLDLESRLRVSIHGGGPFVAYQPMVSLRGPRGAGVEALARWPQQENGVPPERFIQLAEESGLIISLGENVLRTACAQGARWLNSGVPLEFMSVNISGRQVDEPGFFSLVTSCLEESGLPSERLVLELTESVIMERPREAIKMLQSLRARGVRLAIDDFGTGFSSLSHLKHLPVNKLKIDRSFVLGLPEAPQDAVIARAVTALGKSLGLTVVAEGVENEAQLSFLSELGVDYVQGYLLGSPMRPEELDFSRLRQLTPN